MVNAVTSFGRSGLSDWLIQRATAVMMTVYFSFILGVFICNPDMTYVEWKDLFSLTCMKIFTTLTLLSIVAHAWIGGWSVLTDYVTARFFKLELGMDIGNKAIVMRLFLVSIMVLLMLVYTLWGLVVIWGV